MTGIIILTMFILFGLVITSAYASGSDRTFRAPGFLIIIVFSAIFIGGVFVLNDNASAEAYT
jgi:hypothetical protein